MATGSRRALLGGLGAGMVLAGMNGRSRAAPARRIGYAIVGLGSYATRQVMPNFAGCDHARLVALVSGTPAKLDQYGAQYGIPATHRYSYADFERIRDNPDIDAVYVVLPNSLHAEYAVRAAQAGKHVLCEKPMATSVAECAAMIAACRKAGTKLMIGYRSRFEPYNRLAIDLARSGYVGRTRLITAEHGFAIRPDQWRLDRALSGGGSMMDIGIYSLNAARYLTGEEPVEVSAIESTNRSDPRFRTVEDRIGFQLRFPSGILANCLSSYSSGHNGYRVIGAQGWINMEPATPYSGQSMMIRKDGVTAPRILPVAAKNQFAGQLDHLAECILNGGTPIVPGEEGLADLRVIEAIYRSAAERRHVAIST
ncbi:MULTISPECIES: Gfo/Idh/MocA family protein [unclassified Sphingobium]|uniref:Gfo/Idh/MocA family protein n=1 Tax=unclassified Sphingobium TaxID=2611147 RepID=UPI0007F39FA8|nr:MULTISPECIES: Gfo/Idh/MocA family oxidoreductase [unclassified Sphingobium]OAN56660.1 glucose-fructose oxidoreductase [Sphingobium sp. TCM1]WIW90694.1 Gfo/Idh/MocA family oxidoreductase [Sphingobium sp. V4]